MKTITLKEWMRRESISRYRLAKMLGIGTTHVSLILNGKRRSVKIAEKLYDMTDGKISRESVVWADETE